jgi:hypothetical protein
VPFAPELAGFCAPMGRNGLDTVKYYRDAAKTEGVRTQMSRVRLRVGYSAGFGGGVSGMALSSYAARAVRTVLASKRGFVPRIRSRHGPRDERIDVLYDRMHIGCVGAQ